MMSWPIAYIVCCSARLWWPAKVLPSVASTRSYEAPQSVSVSVCSHCAVTDEAMMRSSVSRSVV